MTQCKRLVVLFSVCGLIKCPPGSVMCISGLCSAEWSTDSPVLEDKVINVSRLGNSLVKCCFLFITIHISCWSLSAVKVLAQSLIYSRDCTYLIMSIALIVTIFLDFLIFYCDLFLKRYTYIYIFLYVVLFVQIFFHTCILGKVFGFRFHEALIKLVSASLREVYYTFDLGHNRCLCKKTKQQKQFHGHGFWAILLS